MNAASYLSEVAAALAAVRLEAILIGNAAAALHGSPVMTRDMDFLIRPTQVNLRKLAALAVRLGASLGRPYRPTSEMHRVVRPPNLQLDFLMRMDGVRSFEGLKSRAVRLSIGGHRLLVASLEDVVRSKRAANRPKDRAVLFALEEALEEAKKRKG